LRTRGRLHPFQPQPGGRQLSSQAAVRTKNEQKEHFLLGFREFIGQAQPVRDILNGLPDCQILQAVGRLSWNTSTRDLSYVYRERWFVTEKKPFI
jgi:hypothetical protein